MRVDRPSAIILAVCLPFVLGMAVHGALTNQMSTFWGCLTMLGLFALCIWPIRYEFYPTRLKWRSGLTIFNAVDYTTIDRVVIDRGMGGLTVRKLTGHTIHAGRRKLFICAQDQETVIRELVNRCPHLRQFGHEYRREVASD